MPDHQPSDAPAPAAPHAYVRKRVLIPLICVGLLLALMIAAAVRGTWADTALRNPAAAADGIITQLYQTSDGRKQVRCAMVVDRPASQVWKIVTDYDHFTDIFPVLTKSKSDCEAGGNRCHLTGTVTSVLGAFDFDIHVNHSESAAAFTASWDEPSGNLKVDRGDWTLTPTGADKTLVAYTLEAEVSPYPTFLVRNVLLSGQKKVLTALDDWLKKNPAPNPAAAP